MPLPVCTTTNDVKKNKRKHRKYKKRNPSYKSSKMFKNCEDIPDIVIGCGDATLQKVVPSLTSVPLQDKDVNTKCMKKEKHKNQINMNTNYGYKKSKRSNDNEDDDMESTCSGKEEDIDDTDDDKTFAPYTSDSDSSDEETTRVKRKGMKKKNSGSETERVENSFSDSDMSEVFPLQGIIQSLYNPDISERGENDTLIMSDSESELDEADTVRDVNNPNIYYRKIKTSATDRKGKRKRSLRVYNVLHVCPFCIKKIPAFCTACVQYTQVRERGQRDTQNKN